jgi:hypothetical protein
MKTIIAGSRNCTDKKHLDEALSACGWTPTSVVSGTARGADSLGEDWATRNGVPLERFPANWNLYGRAAGFMRNEEMADHAEAIVALWDGESRGTKHMIDTARRKGLRVYVHHMTIR